MSEAHGRFPIIYTPATIKFRHLPSQGVALACLSQYRIFTGADHNLQHLCLGVYLTELIWEAMMKLNSWVQLLQALR